MRAMVSAATLACGLLAAGCSDTVTSSNPGGKSGGLFAGLRAATPKVEAAEGQTRPRMPLPLARARLAGGDVVVEGPEGYCIDPATAEARANRGFALLASCDILSGGQVGHWVEPVLITVTVGPRGAAEDLPSPAAMAQASGARLLGGNAVPGFVAANLDRGGDSVLDGGDRRHWRGAFVLNGRLVGLALYAPKDTVMAGPKGGGLLARVHERIVTASAGKAQGAQVTSAAPAKTGKGLLGRLFNRKDLP